MPHHRLHLHPLHRHPPTCLKLFSRELYAPLCSASLQPTACRTHRQRVVATSARTTPLVAKWLSRRSHWLWHKEGGAHCNWDASPVTCCWDALMRPFSFCVHSRSSHFRIMTTFDSSQVCSVRKHCSEWMFPVRTKFTRLLCCPTVEHDSLQTNKEFSWGKIHCLQNKQQSLAQARF